MIKGDEMIKHLPEKLAVQVGDKLIDCVVIEAYGRTLEFISVHKLAAALGVSAHAASKFIAARSHLISSIMPPGHGGRPIRCLKGEDAYRFEAWLQDERGRGRIVPTEGTQQQ